jgi:hypothetical protein
MSPVELHYKPLVLLRIMAPHDQIAFQLCAAEDAICLVAHLADAPLEFIRKFRLAY